MKIGTNGTNVDGLVPTLTGASKRIDATISVYSGSLALSLIDPTLTLHSS